MRSAVVALVLSICVGVAPVNAQEVTGTAGLPSDDGLSGAAMCIAAARELSRAAPGNSKLAWVQQVWTRTIRAIPATDEARQAARDRAEATYAEMRAKGPRLAEVAATGFMSFCEKDDDQTAYLARFGSPALRAQVGLIDASVCIASAEYLVANDAVNKPAAVRLFSQWTRIASVINDDAGARSSALIKERGTLKMAQTFSTGNDLFVAQQFASSICEGSEKQVLYLERWGSPALMDAQLEQRPK